METGTGEVTTSEQDELGSTNAEYLAKGGTTDDAPLRATAVLGVEAEVTASIVDEPPFADVIMSSEMPCAVLTVEIAFFTAACQSNRRDNQD